MASMAGDGELLHVGGALIPDSNVVQIFFVTLCTLQSSSKSLRK